MTEVNKQIQQHINGTTPGWLSLKGAIVPPNPVFICSLPRHLSHTCYKMRTLTAVSEGPPKIKLCAHSELSWRVAARAQRTPGSTHH